MARDGANQNLLQCAAAAHRQGRLDDAERLCRRALARDAGSFAAWHRLGLIKISRQDFPAAVELLGKAVAIDGGSAAAHNDLGDALHRQNALDAAAACYRRAIALDPRHADAHANLGMVLYLKGAHGDAIESLYAAVTLDPNDARLHLNLGLALAQQRRLAAAAVCYRSAIRLDPRNVEAHHGLGIALAEQGDPDQALASYRTAMSLDPRHVAACVRLANLLLEQREIVEAIEWYEKTLAINPLQTQVLETLIFQLLQICAWDRVQRWLPELERRLAETSEIIVPFPLLALPFSAAAQRMAAERFARHCQLGSPAPRVAAPRPAGAKAKLRIGYLSADLHAHPTAYLLAEILELHDRSRFDIVAFSYGPDDGSAMRARLRAACDAFFDLRQASDADAARRIEAQAIDILVDLKGYTKGSRTPILVPRPAPIQVNWLGYPGTMGASFIDYIVADRFIVPEGSEGFYAEKIVRLPDTYQPNDRKRQVGPAPSRAECGLPADGTVFCSFNQTYKVGPELFSAWMRILSAVPGSVLWLRLDHPPAEPALRREAEARGIAADRLVFASGKPLSEHLARYRVADLSLDTFPVNSHTTASDALWVGCPLVALAGETFASRVAGSLLHAAGMPELTTTSLADYERLAIRLGSDAHELAALKAKLAADRDRCALFDTPRFVAHLEAAYARMSAIYAAGLPPEHIDVAAEKVNHEDRKGHEEV